MPTAAFSRPNKCRNRAKTRFYQRPTYCRLCRLYASRATPAQLCSRSRDQRGRRGRAAPPAAACRIRRRRGGRLFKLVENVLVDAGGGHPPDHGAKARREVRHDLTTGLSWKKDAKYES